MLDTWESLYPMAGGGGTPIEADMFDAFLEAGYEIDLVTPPSDEPSDFPEHPALRLHRLKPARVKRGGRASRAAALTEFSGRLVRRGVGVGRGEPRPEVVYGLGGHAIPAAAIAGRLLRRPSIGAIYGTFLAPKIGDPAAMRESFEEMLAFRAPVTRLSVLDDGTRGDEVADALGVPAERVLFRPHGIDRAACEAAAAEPAERASLGIPASAPLIVSASRLAPWKRVDRVLRVMELVLKDHPDAVLAIAGDGPAAGELRDLAGELGIAGSVVFTGPLGRRETLRLMAAADVFCSLYDFSNVGLALMEALSCGVAVVAADTGATAGLIEDGANGRLVAAEDLPAAAAAVGGLLDDEELRGSLGAEAARRARSDLLSVEQRMRQELKLVAELAGARLPG